MKYLRIISMLCFMLSGFILGKVYYQTDPKTTAYHACLYGYNTASQTDTKKAFQVCNQLLKLVYGESNEKTNTTN